MAVYWLNVPECSYGAMLAHMSDPTNITIPSDLLPRDGRFGCGPSKVPVSSVDELASKAKTFLGTSHRRAGVRDVVKHIREGLAELFSLPDGYEVVLGNGGATAFWDIATFCLIEKRSEHLSFGEFSSKFAKAARQAPHLEDPVVIESEPGTHPEAVTNPDVDAYALTHNETSTGVAMEVLRPENAQGLVLVDATSAAGGMRVDPTQFDAYYFSPQKCFASDGGLWVALMSPRAIERALALVEQRWVPAFLDLKAAIENSRLQQTLNTPALATLSMMASELNWMLELGGLEAVAKRCESSAANIYQWAESSSYARPFVSDPASRSTVVATIDLDDSIDHQVVCNVLRANGIVDTEPYRKLGRNQLRVALFPAIDPEDVKALTKCVDYVVERLA